MRLSNVSRTLSYLPANGRKRLGGIGRNIIASKSMLMIKSHTDLSRKAILPCSFRHEIKQFDPGLHLTLEHLIISCVSKMAISSRLETGYLLA